MPTHTIRGASSAQVPSPPPFYDQVNGSWRIAGAAWGGARIDDEHAATPLVFNLRSGFYLLLYVVEQPTGPRTTTELLLMVYDSPLPEEPSLRQAAPGREHAAPTPGASEAPLSPMKTGTEVFQTLPSITVGAGCTSPLVGHEWAPLTVALTDPDPAVDITVTITAPPEYTFPLGQVTVLEFPAHSSAVQVTPMLTVLADGPGVFTYDVSATDHLPTLGEFDYLVQPREALFQGGGPVVPGMPISTHLQHALENLAAQATAPRELDPVVCTSVSNASVAVTPNVGTSGFGVVLPIVLRNTMPTDRRFVVGLLAPMGLPANHGVSAALDAAPEIRILPYMFETAVVPAGGEATVRLNLGIARIGGGDPVLATFTVQVDAWVQ